MSKSSVRLKSVQIENFKNIKCAQLSFDNPRKPYRASVLGLYGQNGSGKTALIEALSLLAGALSGRRLSGAYSDFINIDAESATLKYEFQIETTDPHISYQVFYQFSIRREDSPSPADHETEGQETYKTGIFGEVLSFSSVQSDKSFRKTTLIDTREGSIFSPKAKLAAFTGQDKEREADLLAIKKFASMMSISFIFSDEFLSFTEEHCSISEYVFLLKRLSYFGKCELFVIDTTNSALIGFDAFTFFFRYEHNNHTETTAGKIALPLSEPTEISDGTLHIVNKAIQTMNIVLPKLVPGLTISLKDLGSTTMKDGNKGHQIQLMSHKNSKEIALRFESEGIRKIISVLYLLIEVYNNPSVTVAIDELDSGIFEYLLGELLKIISERGKGQLIFTCHNLRPLETLDRGFIAFTTTNPSNRYIRMTKVKPNHNLRDFYYRDIMLGDRFDSIYDSTDNAEIALAFREAGECGEL